MALTWSDFANGESALSIRTKLNAFNNSAVTEVASTVSATNTNTTNIATNTANITTNTTNIATNVSDISALDTRVTAAEATLAEGINDFATLIGNYSTPVAYNLTTTYQDIANYSSSGTAGFTVNTVNGTFTPTHTGYYRISFFMTGSTSESSSKVATTAFVEDGVALFEGSTSFISSTGIDRSFTAIFELTAGNVYKLQIKANTASSVSFDALNLAADWVGS